jgi:hypothetical protein
MNIRIYTHKALAIVQDSRFGRLCRGAAFRRIFSLASLRLVRIGFVWWQ